MQEYRKTYVTANQQKKDVHRAKGTLRVRLTIL